MAGKIFSVFANFVYFTKLLFSRRENSKDGNQCVLVEVLEGRTLSLSKWVVALPFPLPIKATKAKDTQSRRAILLDLGYITHLHTQCLSFSYNHCS